MYEPVKSLARIQEGAEDAAIVIDIVIDCRFKTEDSLNR